MRRKLAAGNWKMHGLGESLAQIAELAGPAASVDCDVLICPPATLIERAARAAMGSAIAIGGQDCHARETGAHTGEISAAMLRDAGATAVILGHSERRADRAEDNRAVRGKARAALAAGLMPVICLGETLEDREADNTLDIIAGQLAGSVPEDPAGKPIVIAYEPVWAIGSGLTPSPDQIARVHGFLRDRLAHRFGRSMAEATRLLYGGSVKPENAATIFAVADVDGALVGGASLTARDFAPIIAALDAA
ncbi:MAG: triose-phosphate isomerase [Rhodobacteraceae bacterium]|nr:MAG: triose-phosphate isomerase [Paracoccaceae bacterium]